MGTVSNDDYLYCDIDKNGNAYFTGSFRDSIDFDPTPSKHVLGTVSGYDLFIFSWDAQANFRWAESIGSSLGGWDQGLDIAVDDSGNSHITGYFQTLVDFDPGPGTHFLTTNGFNDVFVLKLDNSGSFKWAVSFGDSTYHDRGYAINVDDSGNVYTTGSFLGNVDFDPGPSNYVLSSSPHRQADLFLQKLDVNGSFVWAMVFGSEHMDIGYGVTADKYGNSYLTGNFDDTIDFDPGPDSVLLTSVGVDIFIAKFGGCFIDREVNRSGNVLTSSMSSATYQWLDCDSGYSVIPGNTGQSFTPSHSGHYAVALYRNGCSDTSDCISVIIDGIGDNSINSKFEARIYPNPSTGVFRIDFSGTGIREVFIYNSIGELVLQKMVNEDEVRDFDLSGQSDIYLIRFEGPEDYHPRKLIME